ncbi:FAST kinase domain-containing protein 1, mitochondrial isoform X1 [Centropristis striata]|uniref:FAST kinase domain-containing protein 1, mitochondrial isoform X1 n=1 Tax=Centropristis striata TaxID=184440 RepID=UPI0027E0316C|nr:FAST kinase domain-containing protein 1, mitochondrial isoform X1 [Centropristis striata]
MFRHWVGNFFLRRLFHGGPVNRDQVMKQLQCCYAEDQLFDVVGENKADLTVHHVNVAAKKLYQFQRGKPELFKAEDLIKSHPQFLTLRVVAENQIALMDDDNLVDILCNFLRLKVDSHDSLVQQLVSEAWLRLDRFSMSCLSRFSTCLTDHHHSPLMGRIVDIMDQRLSSIDSARSLTLLMVSTSYLMSPRLQGAVLSRVEHFLETKDDINFDDLQRVVQFLYRIRHIHTSRHLLKTCNQKILLYIPKLTYDNIRDISFIVRMYQSLYYSNPDFTLAVKCRLTELMNSSIDTSSFSRLFVCLTPLASQEIRDRLENMALPMAHELSAMGAVYMTEALSVTRSKNVILLKEIVSVIERNLHVYNPRQIGRITEAFFLLKYHNIELSTKLKNLLTNFLQHSVSTQEVCALTRCLSILPCPQLDDVMVSRLNAVMPQCSLYNLCTISNAINRMVRNSPSNRNITPSKFIPLMQNMNFCGLEKLRTAKRLDLLLKQTRFMNGEWFDEILLEEMMLTLERMKDQINWRNVTRLALFITKKSYLCPPLLDRIASVAIQDIDKISNNSSVARALLPFPLLNYDPAQIDNFYDVYVHHITPHFRFIDPHLLVSLGHALSMAKCYPEELVQEVFSIGFLRKLDNQLECVPNEFSTNVRMRLMELNRAVCLECPEFQVPWFHESFCQQWLWRSKEISPVRRQIHKTLGEVLGGSNYVQVAVVTPYFHSVDFECILDRNLQPLPYSQSYERTNSKENDREELPPGAQRVAVNFLDSEAFCKNSHHIKGPALLKQRHLEILGYHVVQIPHFEWNSMELSTADALKEYLRKNLFRGLSA